MTKRAYSKPWRSYQQQLDQLKQRGLIIEDELKARHLLQRLSYYRLSGYWYSLLSIPKKDHRFKEGARFDQAFKLYCFDRELRLLLLREIEKIEVALRAEITYVMSHKHGPFWFQNGELFKDKYRQDSFLKKAEQSVLSSDEAFIQQFQTYYEEDLPPTWMTLEVISFGTLSKLFQNLKPSTETRLIASAFGISDNVLKTWVHALVYVRNVCAHHSRLWNKKLRIQPKIPRKIRKLPYPLVTVPVDNQRVYFIIVIVRYLLFSVNPQTTFPQKVSDLLSRYPNTDPAALGFPEKWTEEPIWIR